jgi:hypothetical protein
MEAIIGRTRGQINRGALIAFMSDFDESIEHEDMDEVDEPGTWGNSTCGGGNFWTSHQIDDAREALTAKLRNRDFEVVPQRLTSCLPAIRGPVTSLGAAS